MTTIREIHNPWRDGLLQASYKGSPFHVDSGSISNGRRIVLHEFPKRDTPYAEDMGRKAYRFVVRAYCIAFPYYASQLYQPDYRQPRDQLRNALDKGGAGSLQLPTMRSMQVVCEGYRLTEEEKYGGYCVFDIQFAEAGSASGPAVNSTTALITTAMTMAAASSARLTAGPLMRR